MAVSKNLVSFIWRELPLFWKYTFLVAVAYTIIFFLASFSVLLFALDFLTPFIFGGIIIFVWKTAIGWRKWIRIRGGNRRKG
ncbi:MAG: hypothetical protein NTY66_03835 [Candidatus Vogelbacteria bacterium]|nr:hypothetical protein [Candidatus Vogelbacteria bacterium]